MKNVIIFHKYFWNKKKVIAMVNNLLVHTPKIEKKGCLTTDIYIDYKEII